MRIWCEMYEHKTDKGIYLALRVWCFVLEGGIFEYVEKKCWFMGFILGSEGEKESVYIFTWVGCLPEKWIAEYQNV